MQDRLAEERAKAGNEDVAKVIRRMKVEEDTRHTHRKIKIATKPFGGAVTRLSIIDENEPEGRRTTTNQQEIEQALMTEYEYKYRLAYSSPLMQYPLRDELGVSGDTIHAEDVLQGTYVPPPLTSDATRTFLEYSKMDDSILENGPNDDVITPEDCNEFWNSMKERVQSSKSGKHVGTYKAAT